MEYIDGVTCINIYSQGKTKLGKDLSNWAHTPFVCDDGHFESVEGYWYWIQTGDNHLRTLYGYKAKEYGKRAREKNGKKLVKDFNEKIKKAIRAKIIQNELYNALAESKLPLVHYYEYGDKKVFMPQYDWIVKYIEECRTKLQNASYPK